VCMKASLGLLVAAATVSWAGYSVEWSVGYEERTSYVALEPYNGRLDVDGDDVSDLGIRGWSPDSVFLTFYSGVTHAPTWEIDMQGWRCSDVTPWLRVGNTDSDPSKELVFTAQRTDSFMVKFFVFDCQSHALEYASPPLLQLGGGTDLFDICDLDGDGRDEIIVVGSRYRLDIYGWSASSVSDGPASTPFSRRAIAVPNPSTREVEFELPPGPSSSAIEISDAAGRVVRSLSCLAADHVHGRRVVTWDCRDDEGARVPAGSYFYQYAQTHGKMNVVR
jgi:hypothetical protein